MYTGGLENRPRLIGRIAAQRPLWGNDAAVLKVVRDPATLPILCRQRGLPCPDVRLYRHNVPPTGRWLAKPVRGAGGAGIRFLSADVPETPRSRIYCQEYIEGDSCAALYVGDGSRATLLGTTRQLVGEAWLHAAPFRYCGSIGPLRLEAGLREALQRLGTAIVEHCELRGLFGVDCVVRDGIPYPVEVNPRYTASVEVWEQATGIPALGLHRRVFDPNVGGPEPRPTPGNIIGKAVLFAQTPLTFPTDGPWMATLPNPSDVWDLPAFADIPQPGTPIEKGRPILTFFAQAGSVESSQEKLRRIAADLDRWLFGRHPL